MLLPAEIWLRRKMFVQFLCIRIFWQWFCEAWKALMDTHWFNNLKKKMYFHKFNVKYYNKTLILCMRHTFFAALTIEIMCTCCWTYIFYKKTLLICYIFVLFQHCMLIVFLSGYFLYYIYYFYRHVTLYLAIFMLSYQSNLSLYILAAMEVSCQVTIVVFEGKTRIRP